MNSVGCARDECEYFMCEYCFDTVTKFFFKEEQILSSDGCQMYLYNAEASSSICYHWIDKNDFQKIELFNKSNWKTIKGVTTLDGEEKKEKIFSLPYSKVLSFNANTFIVVGGSNQNIFKEKFIKDSNNLEQLHIFDTLRNEVMYSQEF